MLLCLTLLTSAYISLGNNKVYIFLSLYLSLLGQQQICESFTEQKMCSAQRGARTHDPEIKSLMLYRLS